MRTMLAVDPGASGGFAWVDSVGEVQATRMPDGMTGMVDRLRELRTDGRVCGNGWDCSPFGEEDSAISGVRLHVLP